MQVFFGPCVAAGGGGGVLGKTGLVRFQWFSLSAVGVLALAPTTAMQLDVGTRRLAVAGGAEEAAPRT